ncbi:gluconate:H+ symporter [Thermosipho sp. (in: thermotogales)]|jgi:GntP family gluconate:H+ symporter|uniref:GntP family permease n=1 Tax=Thermosipho sp. (in: thermotogales) TaxID=1968895 RepID=UPI00257C26BE|nr:gluconate:H+ symporter [Thermosipho sp. (in: thermotogales)]MBZ4649991.1 gluconate transporter [Thermosipho sp. (in: thermotogales)]MDK2907474.1 gluconate:H+ symporter, GntP family [Petrotoga sp.]MDK2946773.1 gluconate:H+ symporter, GntP family [Geotoga sp.]
MTAVNEGQLIFGLIVGIILLLVMILKTKIHPFPALIISAAAIGVIGGLPPSSVVNSITKGFGGTLGSIGIIIGFGIMMGRIFEISGAAETMARTFLKWLGKGKEEVALALTGFVVSIPIFCDSGFVILFPLAKAISKNTKKSIISLGVSMALGLVITHSLVPPTPGPVGVAGIFGVSVGSMILWGLVLAIPMLIGGLLYANWLGKRIYQIPAENGEGWVRPSNAKIEYKELGKADKNLPSPFASFAPLIVPIVLILIQNIAKLVGVSGVWKEIFGFVGSPVIAVGIGLLIAIYGLAGKVERKELLGQLEKGIRSAGIIIFVTGAGGALGMVLRDSGIGTVIAEAISKTSLPPILLPFIIATLVRFVQGSGTVAMITAASISAPIIANLSINPLFAALAASIGSLFFSYFNDSYFWVVNRMMGIEDTKEQIKVWSITTTIAWGIGLVELLVISLFV